MWLVTAVGSVHGQDKFTFALEQKKTYTVGRDRNCVIRFESRHVRPREGSLIVGDWDPTNRLKPPELKWKLEPKKIGTFGAFKTIAPRDENLVGSLDKEDYDLQELDGAHECFLGDLLGMGIELAEDGWFIIVWADLHLQYDKMKDESEEVHETLRKFCVSWTQTFDISDKPHFVLSSTYKSSPDCNYAVCFGVRILLPAYLNALLSRFRACWKKVADSQDSFSLPDEMDRIFQPQLDTALPKSRGDVQCWLPDDRRLEMFQGWKLMGLRGQAAAAERRYLTAMGGQYAELDVISRPLLSGKDFQDRIAGWIQEVKSENVPDQALVVYFSGVKEGLAKQGVDFSSVVGTVCQRLGIAVVSGAVCWGAVKQGGVREYIDFMASAGQAGTTAAASSSVRAPANTFAVPDLPHHRAATQLAPSPSTQQSPPRSTFIPSTFPDEVDDLSVRRQPSPPRARTIQKEVECEPQPSIVKDSLNDSQPSARRPLKRRAGRPVDLFQDELFDAPASLELESTQKQSMPSSSQPSMGRDESPAPLHEGTHSRNVDSLMPSLPGKSRLKRRGGPETQQSLFDLGLDASFEQDRKSMETSADIRKLYEQTKVRSPRPVMKRSRINTRQQPAEPMDLDPDEEDPIQFTLKKAARLKKEGKTQTSQALMPPPAQITRGRSPTEEPEEVEEPTSPKKTPPRRRTPSPVKKSTQTKSSTPVTTDEAFLKAITKASKSKKAVDELDKEFNQLRIPKPGAPGGSTVVKANVWDATHPDYTIVNDFDDDLRGNFIQIVRKDLMRKDIGTPRSERVDDGRPNFKKFKKKNVTRREPVQLVLAGPTIHDAEMGEPYWPPETTRPSARSQGVSQAFDEGDDMPLLPRTRKRLLGEDGAESTPPGTSPGPFAPPTQTHSTLRLGMTQIQRKTRRQSVESDVCTANLVPIESVRTRSGPKNGKAKVKEPIVLEDDDENDPTPPTRSTRSDVTSTLQGDASRSVTPRSTQTATAGRRKLLPADDDDGGMVFRGLAKKRRLG